MRRSGVRSPSAPPITLNSSTTYKHNSDRPDFPNWPISGQKKLHWMVKNSKERERIVDVRNMTVRNSLKHNNLDVLCVMRKAAFQIASRSRRSA